MTLRYRRAGEPAAPTPLRAHRAVEPSTRRQRSPGRGNAIRGLVDVVERSRQTEESWRETWASEIAEKEQRR